MVQVEWRKTALRQLKQHLEYSYTEFGAKTMNEFIQEVEQFEERLHHYPLSYSIVPQLAEKERDYRGCVVMRNFKIIYYYDEKAEKVIVSYIWDMRMNPQKLEKKFK